MNSSEQEKAFKKVENATVKICNAEGKTIGTGFYVSSDGYFVTCAHVILDAGGLESIRVDGREAIWKRYIGDPSQDDIALLQIISPRNQVFLPLTSVWKDKTFRCFGFSNNTYKDGASIEGRITSCAISTDISLRYQQVLRLITEGDSQAIKGGQSGAAICVYNSLKKRWEASGVLVASEDKNGGIALLSEVIRNKIPKNSIDLYWNITKIGIGILSISIISAITFFSLPRNCSEDKLQADRDRIEKLLSAADSSKASNLANKFENECPNDSDPIIIQGFVLMNKALNNADEKQSILKLTKEKFTKVLDNPKSTKNVEAVYGLGLTLYEMGKYEEAIKQLNKVEDEEEFRIKAHYYIGYSYWQLKERYFEDAERYLNRAITYIKNKVPQWNEVNTESNGTLYENHRHSLLLLINISQELWYFNQNNPAKKKEYIKKYIDYNKFFVSEIILPQNKKAYLDEELKSITLSDGNTNSFNYVVSSVEYKCMMLDLYKKYINLPIKLEVKCSL